MKYIEKLLPAAGVEWKKLGEVADIYGGLTGKTKADFENGNALFVPYKNIYENYEVNAKELAYVKVSDDEKQHKVEYGDVLFTGSSETVEEVAYSSAVTTHFEGAIYLNSFSFGVRFHKEIELMPEFSKHLFREIGMRKQLKKTASGVTRFNVSKKRFKHILIPIPPLHVQQEIVRILDKFTELETELEAKLETELELRKQQYERYRDQLLSPDKGLSETEVEWKKLGEVAEYSSRKVNAIALSKHNYIGVDNLLQNKAGKKDSNYVPTDGNFTAYTIGDVLIGNIRPYLKKIWLANQDGGTNGDVLVIHTTDKSVDAEYLYQVLADDKFFVYNMQYAKGAKMPRGNKQKIMDYLIPIPPLHVQQRIVSLLDKFHTLTTSISEGLPREIELRKQQYAYYRDQLLSFER